MQPTNSLYECGVFVCEGGPAFVVLFHVACREIWVERPGQCQPYLECRSWCECCSRVQKRSDAGCLAIPGRTPSSRGETAPPQRGTIPPSCWSVSRLRWGRGTARGWAGEAPPRYSSMLLESRCSSWDCTFLEQKQKKIVVWDVKGAENTNMV